MAKKVLGRGLGAFFPDYDNEEKGSTGRSEGQTAAESKNDPSGKVNIVLDIPIRDIRPNPNQPRKDFKDEALDELAGSIRKHGIIQPVTVRYIGQRRFELISGERRLRASKLAGKEEIPAYIREADDEQVIAFALIENIQREELNPLEIAMGYQRLMDECSYTQTDVAERVGKNRTTVTNTLRLLQLPDFIQAALRDEEISGGHARALINVRSESEQISLLKKIVSSGLSVRQTEEMVRNLEKKRDQARKPKAVQTGNPFLESLVNRLRKKLGTKVLIQEKGNGGRITIEYYSEEDLERLIQHFDEMA
ncbi:MAG: ParB/RepB/Spo0J family partition protein [Balneolaceae bacterium]|nr:MAG: ParB/RepB/Spo0J family partition protein [Balneolaceae bacterium]